jgi:hypothetical protein
MTSTCIADVQMHVHLHTSLCGSLAEGNMPVQAPVLGLFSGRVHLHRTDPAPRLNPHNTRPSAYSRIKGAVGEALAEFAQKPGVIAPLRACMSGRQQTAVWKLPGDLQLSPGLCPGSPAGLTKLEAGCAVDSHQPKFRTDGGLGIAEQ